LADKIEGLIRIVTCVSLALTSQHSEEHRVGAVGVWPQLGARPGPKIAWFEFAWGLGHHDFARIKLFEIGMVPQRVFNDDDGFGQVGAARGIHHDAAGLGRSQRRV